MKLRKIFRTTPLLVIAGLELLGCSQSVKNQDKILTPNVTGPSIDAGAIPMGGGKRVKLSNDVEIYVQNRGGKLFYQVEAAIAPESFSQITSAALHLPPTERENFYISEMDKVIAHLKKVRGIELFEAPEMGYFTFEMPYESDLMGPLKSLKMGHSVMMEPVSYQPEVMDEIQKLNPAAEGFAPRADFREGSAGFSGLERMRVPEFLKQAEADIGDGTPVNGSKVLVGVTDTGVTLNHPTFFSEQPDGSKKNRILYMRDFTREGRVYFHPTAKFEAKVPVGNPPDVLFVTAQIIPTPKVPNIPVADKFIEMKDIPIKVSPELRELLLKPGSGAKLGVLDEAVISSKDEPVDINADGKSDSKIPMILIPAEHPEDDQLYVDLSGSMDFRYVKPVGDWNKTKQTVRSYAEELGFDIRNDTLPGSDEDSKVMVRAASLVGFDPGNHGTHVSGIIAGSKTIQNDSKNTLARGVAPEANLAVNRVCANNSGCNAVAAFVDLAARGVDVINMSLGGLSNLNDGYGMQEMMINRLSAMKNILFIISAGNSGPGRQTIGTPSVASAALSVGASATRAMIQKQYQWPALGSEEAASRLPEAVAGNEAADEASSKASAQEDFLLFFSSRGPTAAGGFKPGVTAPGTELSSIQLNTAPGMHGGLDVYWGTSMAAPSAAGAYALLLDAIRKYNEKHPATPLTQNAMKLKEVLMQSARPFDVSRFDPATGERLFGQYSWIDEGTGMIDLEAAWKKLKDLRDSEVPSAVSNAGSSVDLDYEVIVPLKNPQGLPYDGTLSKIKGLPSFGKGLYLTYSGTETSRQVSLGRRLPLVATQSPLAGSLMRQLRTTQDEFILKTFIYGSDQVWLKAGVLDDMTNTVSGVAGSCAGAESTKVRVIGEGATIQSNSNGIGGKLAAQALGNVNFCIDREMIRNSLQPGDHGALVYGYRVVDGKVNALPSFTIPVYLTVPHHTLANSTAYDVQRAVESFGVQRNYVTIPQGTSLVKITVETPEIKRGANGLMEKGESCSGVELMPLIGGNTSKFFKSRAEARISNCDANGGYSDPGIKRKLSFTVSNPKAGVWDLPVLGSFRYPKSKYRLRVDYLAATSGLKEIKGGVEALRGQFSLSLQDSSLDLAPSAAKSSFELNSLMRQANSKIANGEILYFRDFATQPNSAFRSYPAELKKVTLSTGGSPGNDLDLYILECPKEAPDPNDSNCVQIGQSETPTDEETVTFEPKADKVYAFKVVGSAIKDEGKFLISETLNFTPENGSLQIRPAGGGVFNIEFGFSDEQLASSAILSSESYRSGRYSGVGALKIRSSEDTAVLFAVPVSISLVPVPSGNQG
ncbi:MAG: S8 family serine peptidase [Bdellovibrio sp.]|nr:S8 family serine peptidase [Bdellovibrio sp.]